jgi:hypothetical protein
LPCTLTHRLIEQTRVHFQTLGDPDRFNSAKLTADSGFYNTANVTHFYQNGIDGYLPEPGFRKRNPRFAEVERYRARNRNDKARYYRKTRCHCTSPDFRYDETAHPCLCPAGRRLYSNGRAKKFRGAKRDCLPCPHRDRCVRVPTETQARQVAIFIGRSEQAPPSDLDLMRRKIDMPQGRYQYSRRMGIVEPVFANICRVLGIDRFSLRSKKKVDIQWKRYCMVHNLLKIHRYGALGIT